MPDFQQRSPNTARDREVEEDARDWVIRFASGSPSENEQRRFRTWLDADPRHRTAFGEAKLLWDESAAYAGIARRRAGKRSAGLGSRPRRLTLALGAVMAVICGVFALDLEHRIFADHVTGAGEQSSIILPDGSTAHLNVETALSIDFEGEVRVVSLLSGEADFSVFNDPSRPFVARAGDVEVTATGTVFSIRRTDDDTLITVTEGSIDVAATAFPTVVSLRDGEQSHVARGQTPSPGQAIDLKSEMAWRNGLIVISDESFDAALAEISRYADAPVLMVSGTSGLSRVTARIRIDEVDAGLDALARANDLRVTRLPFLTIVD